MKLSGSRSETSIAGVLAFCYLANNYGYTGDWFSGNLKDLNPTQTLLWFQHAFSPAAVFINLTDERYTRFAGPHDPGSTLLFNLVGINNLPSVVKGKVVLKIIDQKGNALPDQSLMVNLQSFLRTDIPVSVTLPEKAGGYVVVSEFTPENGNTVISRRFIRVGVAPDYSYFNLKP